MKKIIWVVVVLVIVLIIVVSSTDSKKTARNSFVIGVSTPTTGPIAFAGESYMKGLEVAAKKINDEGGIQGKPVSFVVEDNANEAKASLSSFDKLRYDNPDMYIITGSVPSAAVSPVADRAGIPLFISMSFSNTQATFQNQVSFYPTATGDAQATAVTMSANKVSKVAIMYLNTDYGQAVLKAFKAEAASKGITIVSEDSFLATDTTFSTQISKALATKPDAVFVIAINALPVIKSLKTFSAQMAIYTNNPAVSGSLIYKDPATFDGVYLTGYKSTIPGTAEYAKIRSEVGSSSPRDTLGYTAAAYDNLMAIAAVLKKNPNTAEFVRAFSTYGSFSGINGTYSLSSRDISIPLYPVVFKNGVLSEVK
jgi:branched-chain amino acid transport system substrate-binding protein